MATYFETAVRFRKMQENGIEKPVTEKYLVNALSFTEAEERIVEEMRSRISGEYSIRAVRRMAIAEIFHQDMDRFYLAKAAFVTLDEKTGTEKKTVSQILVGGENFDAALVNLKEGMKGTIADWELQSLAETQILEIFGANLELANDADEPDSESE